MDVCRLCSPATNREAEVARGITKADRVRTAGMAGKSESRLQASVGLSNTSRKPICANCWRNWKNTILKKIQKTNLRMEAAHKPTDDLERGLVHKRTRAPEVDWRLSFDSENQIDARDDSRWVSLMESLSLRQDYHGMWRFARTAPPIWTIRVVKYLVKNQWQPDADDQLELFQTLIGYANACNEFDLPGPGTRAATKSDWGERIAAARITDDGEFIFLVNQKATALDIVTSDLLSVCHIRLDVWRGNQVAPLAVAVSPSGHRLVVLVLDLVTLTFYVRLWVLAEGEIKGEHSFKLEGCSFGHQVPVLEISGDGNRIVILDDSLHLFVFDALFFRLLHKISIDSPPLPYPGAPVQESNHASDWRNFGQRCIADPLSRGVKVSHRAEYIAVRTEQHPLRIDLSQTPPVIAVPEGETTPTRSTVENFRLSMGEHSGTIVFMWDNLFDGNVRYSGQRKFVLWEANVNYVSELLVCSGWGSQIALSDRDDLAVFAMPAREAVVVIHLPDGRILGTLAGLEPAPIADLRVTSGGSVISVARTGQINVWAADGNGNAWPWSRELVRITHQAVDESGVELLRQAEAMRQRGWLSIQEVNLLDLALALLLNRLGLEIEIDWDDTRLPGDNMDIEIDDE